MKKECPNCQAYTATRLRRKSLNEDCRAHGLMEPDSLGLLSCSADSGNIYLQPRLIFLLISVNVYHIFCHLNMNARLINISYINF